MDFPETPCDSCPRVSRGLNLPCKAQVTKHARFCEHAAAGHEGYIAILCGETPPPPPTPSLLDRARSLGGALVTAVKTKAKQVSAREQNRRLSICRECEHFEAAEQKCRVCTCYMPLKTRLEGLHCPLPEPKW